MATKKIGLYKCGKQWRVRWFGEYEPKTEKQKRYSKTFDRKADAEKFREEKKKEFGQGVRRDPSNESLKDYCERWLHCKTKIERVRPATVLLYKGTFQRLYDYFGPGRLFVTIDRGEAMSFLASLKPKIERNEPLSNWSQHRVLRHCKTLFSGALEEGIISVNPFVKIKGPKCTPSDWYYLKSDEFHSLLDVTSVLREKVLYVLALTAGLRKTEAFALCWFDIDFASGKVHIINRKASDEYPPFYVKDKDTRTILLPRFTIKLLTELHNEAPENVPFVLMDEQGCQRIKDKWQQCREQNKSWDDRNWENNALRNFKRRTRQAGINAQGKKLTIHILRKCYTQLLRGNVPDNVVKELLGHSNIETTDRFYSTVDESHLKAAAKVVDDFLVSGTTDHKLTFSGVSGENQRV